MTEQKFRRLKLDELTAVRDQFVKFLAVNGIDADSWQKMKESDPQESDRLVLQFSQIVFSGVIEKVNYLIHRRPNDLRTYKCDEDKIYMRGILLDGVTTVDFTRDEFTPQEMFERLKSENVKAKLYSAERPYRPHGRDQDVFLVMEEGALTDDGELFRTLERVK